VQACAPLRLGYVNQHRPPFFIGSGSLEPAAPGATVELLREAAASAGCKVITVRLPSLRLRPALDAGDIDALLMDADDSETQSLALPLDTSGHPDKTRGLPMFTMVFVRTSDRVPADTDPVQYFATRTIGVNNGATVAKRLRQDGFRVDDGALDSVRNLEKLVRGRIDGYASIMVGRADGDANVAALYGTQLQRLDKPLRTQHFWLAFTKRYQAANRTEVDTMWDWIGSRGHARFVELIGKYNKPR
jgi:ABC-type amino acid transport substrate-binding protein